MRTIRIEEVGDIQCKYNYLEVFLDDSNTPFLDISISDERYLVFKFYPSDTGYEIGIEDWEHVLSTANNFLPKALKNEDDFIDFFGDEY